jgi:aminoglycoside phosphotransferase (APT) family kinase protein
LRPSGRWTLLDDEGRRAFRDRLAVDPAAWAWGRGWALWKTLSAYAQVSDRDGQARTRARRVLQAIIDEYETEKSPRVT